MIGVHPASSVLHPVKEAVFSNNKLLDDSESYAEWGSKEDLQRFIHVLNMLMLRMTFYHGWWDQTTWQFLCDLVWNEKICLKILSTQMLPRRAGSVNIAGWCYVKRYYVRSGFWNIHPPVEPTVPFSEDLLGLSCHFINLSLVRCFSDYASSKCFWQEYSMI